ncbi:MAG TPA: type II toxin-antitoxin system VapC family toxin [Tepidisphaeraceae bacterium]|nr:type II toxin-antitoxin system VapC family toxin [Tepidisphaeraceae bacterium]
MTRYLLDTNHSSQLVHHERSPIWDRLDALSRKQYGLCWPSIGELWFMMLNSAKVERNRARLNSLLPQFSIWRFEDEEAFQFALLRVELRKAGRPIPAVDMMIAAIARANNLVLVTADRHFDLISGLKVENWIA